MEKLCRACGSELAVIVWCKGCGQPIRWMCDTCLREKDSTHVHENIVQYVLAE